MKIGKTIAILTIAASVSLFANGISNVSTLVEQINGATDMKVKTQLKKKLENELATMNKQDLPKAKEIIDSKLKK